MKHAFRYENNTAFRQDLRFILQPELDLSAKVVRVLDVVSDKSDDLIEIVGMYALIFSVNDYLAGVYEASSRQQAETVARMLLRSLQTADSNQ